MIRFKLENSIGCEPFWDNAAMQLLAALVFYAAENPNNMEKIFDDLEIKSPDSAAAISYKAYKNCAGGDKIRQGIRENLYLSITDYYRLLRGDKLKIRVEGGLEDIQRAVSAIQGAFVVNSVSKPYKNKADNHLRVYIDIKNITSEPKR